MQRTCVAQDLEQHPHLERQEGKAACKYRRPRWRLVADSTACRRASEVDLEHPEKEFSADASNPPSAQQFLTFLFFRSCIVPAPPETLRQL